MRRSTGLFARLALVHVPVLVLVTAFASSCASQTEGERCDPRNGSDDCESGLKCVKLDASDPDRYVGICCPVSASGASDVCSQSDFTPAPDGGAASGGASGPGDASSAGGESAAGGASSSGGASASGGADAGAAGASAGGASAAGGTDAGAVPDASGD